MSSSAGRKTLYQVLGVAKSSSAGDIKKAYLVLAKKHHPDTLHREEYSEFEKKRISDKFKEISNAYATLSNEQSRRKYDQELSYEQNLNSYRTRDSGFGNPYASSSSYYDGEKRRTAEQEFYDFEEMFRKARSMHNRAASGEKFYTYRYYTYKDSRGNTRVGKEKHEYNPYENPGYQEQTYQWSNENARKQNQYYANMNNQYSSRESSIPYELRGQMRLFDILGVVFITMFLFKFIFGGKPDSPPPQTRDAYSSSLIIRPEKEIDEQYGLRELGKGYERLQGDRLVKRITDHMLFESRTPEFRAYSENYERMYPRTREESLDDSPLAWLKRAEKKRMAWVDINKQKGEVRTNVPNPAENFIKYDPNMKYSNKNKENGKV